MPEFVCDVSKPGRPLSHVWEHTVGSGYARLALRADWQTQLKRCREELGVRHVRFHGLLSDDVGTLTRQRGELIYSFFNADQIMDFLHTIDMHPFVELSFMPSALATGDKTVFYYSDNVTPPSDYAQWEHFIHKLVKHWVARYGVEDVRQWYFEVWNEPNLNAFWTGNQAEYFELYRRTVNAIKAVDEELSVGGPATANDEWIEAFVGFCTDNNLPADFVSTHHYPTDAFGEPGDDTDPQLAAAKRGILRERAMDTRRRAAGRPVYYTEWSTSSNPFYHRHDEPYAAAFAMKCWLDVANVVDGYSYWTFSDIFEENYFSSQPFHGGFGLQTIHGIAKPAYRAAELLHRAGDEQLTVDGLHSTVNCWVTRKAEQLVILLTNHALPDHPLTAEAVTLNLHGATLPQQSIVERIDDAHANPRALWEDWGKPDYLGYDQVKQLNAASTLRPVTLAWRTTDAGIVCNIQLPAHGVAALTLDFANHDQS